MAAMGLAEASAAEGQAREAVGVAEAEEAGEALAKGEAEGTAEVAAAGGAALEAEVVVESAVLVAAGSEAVAMVALEAGGLAEAVVKERVEERFRQALHAGQRGQNYSAAARGSREPTAHTRHFR
jgi:hypothetical protein